MSKESAQAILAAIPDEAHRHAEALRMITHLDLEEYGLAGVALAANLIANLALNPQAS